MHCSILKPRFATTTALSLTITKRTVVVVARSVSTRLSSSNALSKHRNEMPHVPSVAANHNLKTMSDESGYSYDNNTLSFKSPFSSTSSGGYLRAEDSPDPDDLWLAKHCSKYRSLDVNNNAEVLKRLPPPSPGVRRGTPVRFDENLGFVRSRSVGFRPTPLAALLTRSPSPALVHTRRSCTPRPRRDEDRRSCTPRRTFPQAYYAPIDEDQPLTTEDSPVVLDANLTFVLGCKTRLKPRVDAVPAHKDEGTTSAQLTNKIEDFLLRTDHVMDEWRGLGHKDEEDGLVSAKRARRLGRSRSATNILIKGFQYYSRASSCCSRSTSVARGLSEDRTFDEVNYGEVCVRIEVVNSVMLRCD